MSRKFIPLFLSFLVLSNKIFAEGKCDISENEKQKYLKMDFLSFDQTPHQGWRFYGENECYLTAANLLESYYIYHIDLPEDQKRIVTFHTGQMYAFSNEYEKAIAKFELSFNPHEPIDTPILWNAYVDATIAFLKKDMNGLIENFNKIANGLTFEGKKINLDVVNGFIKCFDKPYSEAYQELCRIKE